MARDMMEDTIIREPGLQVSLAILHWAQELAPYLEVSLEVTDILSTPYALVIFKGSPSGIAILLKLINDSHNRIALLLMAMNEEKK